MFRKLIGIGCIALGCFVCWQIGGSLSRDALGMALGVIFGMMAGIPAALIALAGSRDRTVVHVHRLEMQQPPQESAGGLWMAVAPSMSQRGQIVAGEAVRLPVVAKQERLGVGR